MTLSHIDITSYIWYIYIYIYTYITIYVLYAVWGIYNMLYTCFVYVKLLILAATHAWFVDILASGHLSSQASRAPGQSVHSADFSVQPPLLLSLSISLYFSLSGVNEWLTSRGMPAPLALWTSWTATHASLARNGLTYDVRQCTYTVGRFT